MTQRMSSQTLSQSSPSNAFVARALRLAAASAGCGARRSSAEVLGSCSLPHPEQQHAMREYSPHWVPYRELVKQMERGCSSGAPFPMHMLACQPSRGTLRVRYSGVCVLRGGGCMCGS